MKHYALIFHTTRTLTPEQLEQRKLEIAAWVQRVTDVGITLDPRALGETAATFSAEGNEIVSHKGPSDSTLRNLVFFDSPSRDQAVGIARIHPGLHYGATVEVREWTSPRETTANNNPLPVRHATHLTGRQIRPAIEWASSFLIPASSAVQKSKRSEGKYMKSGRTIGNKQTGETLTMLTSEEDNGVAVQYYRVNLSTHRSQKHSLVWRARSTCISERIAGMCDCVWVRALRRTLASLTLLPILRLRHAS